MNAHFKNFFESYFDYPYERLDFFLMNESDIKIAATYQLEIKDVKTFFIHKKINLNSSVNYYGFLLINDSDFYIPIDVLCLKDYCDPSIDLTFNLKIKNSLFDYKFIPLNYTKTFDYINRLMNALPKPISKFISENEKDFMFLNTSFMDKFYFYFDLDSSYTEINSRSNHHYNQLTVANFYNDQHRRFEYDLHIKGESELLRMSLLSNTIDEFNCEHLLAQSLTNYNSLMTVDSTNFITMREQLIQHRKINSIYGY